MTTPISSSVLPAVNNMFATMDLLLDKAAQRCEETNVEQSVYLNWRVAPDMFPLMTQFRFASEIPARGLSRLAGAPLPSFEDNETTFADLKGRIEKATQIIETFDLDAIDANPKADITVPMGPGNEVTLPRGMFAHEWIMPNLYFHVTTAYLILRGFGVDLGKRDFLTGVARKLGA